MSRVFGRVAALCLAAACVFLAQPLWGQSETEWVRIRDLNSQILRLWAGAGAKGSVRAAGGRAAEERLLAERAGELMRLMQRDPKAALSLAFPREVADRIRLAYPGAADSVEEYGAWSGQLDHVVLEDAERGWATRRIALAGDGRDRILFFAGPEPPDAACGDEIAVEGYRLGRQVLASTAHRMAQSSAGCSTVGRQRIAVIPVAWPGQPLAAHLTREWLDQAMFGGGGRSLNEYWQEVSHGKAGAEGRVLPELPMPRAYGCDEYEALWRDVLARVDSEVDFTVYQRVFLVFPKPPGCPWSGMATVGCRRTATGEGEAGVSISWLVSDYLTSRENLVALAAHEGGHNLGLSHAASLQFNGEVLGAPGSPGRLNEYGDRFSAMGYWSLGHYSARHKLRLGWIGPENIMTAEGAGTWKLQPAAAASPALQALRITRNCDSSLWIEARQPLGVYESLLKPQAFQGALVHFEDAATGSRTHLLDFSPETASLDDAVAAAGRSWTDPYTGIRLAIHSSGPDGVLVSVGQEQARCGTAPLYIELSPRNPVVAPGGEVRLVASITNPDPAQCAPSRFAVTADLPGAWLSEGLESPLEIEPGKTVEVPFRLLAGSELGQFAVRLVVEREQSNGVATANCTVAPDDTR